MRFEIVNGVAMNIKYHLLASKSLNNDMYL